MDAAALSRARMNIYIRAAVSATKMCAPAAVPPALKGQVYEFIHSSRWRELLWNILTALNAVDLAYKLRATGISPINSHVFFTRIHSTRGKYDACGQSLLFFCFAAQKIFFIRK